MCVRVRVCACLSICVSLCLCLCVIFMCYIHILSYSHNCATYNVGDEKKLVEQVFTNAIDCLSDDDKKLPQVCMYQAF